MGVCVVGSCRDNGNRTLDEMKDWSGNDVGFVCCMRVQRNVSPDTALERPAESL